MLQLIFVQCWFLVKKIKKNIATHWHRKPRKSRSQY